MAHPEHELQVQVNKWVRECVPQPHFFTSIDRGKKTGLFTHVRQKARGMVAGTPDTVLQIPGLPMIAIELKAPGGKPSDNQRRAGAKIIEAGGIWGWCDSVVGYADIIANAGIPLDGRARILAEHYDGILRAAAIEREEKKTGKPSSKRFVSPLSGEGRRTKPTPAQIDRAEALRRKVMY